jgi:nicotinic acid mononucleotide adenylyltransferase
MIPTYFLMKELSLSPLYKESELYFVMGTDLLTSLHLWEEAEAFKKEVNFIIFKRDGWDETQMLDKLPQNYRIVEGIFTGMSSSKIKQRIKTIRSSQPENQTIGVLGLVTEGVKQYIVKNSLY